MSDNMNRVRAALRHLRKVELVALMNQMSEELSGLEELDASQQVDTLADIKAAHAAGKTIVFRPVTSPVFAVTASPAWNYELIYKALESDEELDVFGNIVKVGKWAGEKEAFYKKGKKIAWRTSDTADGEWHVTKNPSWRDGFEYKVVEDDVVTEEKFYIPDLGEMVNLVFTKSGVTGKVTVVIRE